MLVLKRGLIAPVWSKIACTMTFCSGVIAHAKAHDLGFTLCGGLCRTIGVDSWLMVPRPAWLSVKKSRKIVSRYKSEVNVLGKKAGQGKASTFNLV